jgi:hypothetical protein
MTAPVADLAREVLTGDTLTRSLDPGPRNAEGRAHTVAVYRTGI